MLLPYREPRPDLSPTGGAGRGPGPVNFILEKLKTGDRISLVRNCLPDTEDRVSISITSHDV